MKTIVSIIIAISSLHALNAQIAIGKENMTNSSVLLEFADENRGIILPSVDEATGAAEGTFIFNTSTRSVQVLQNAEWLNLTDENQGVLHNFNNQSTDTGTGVILGANSSGKPGVLVLESTTQALVLPHVENPHLNINGAIAGTIVYDSISDMFAVYDGANWSYWK